MMCLGTSLGNVMRETCNFYSQVNTLVCAYDGKYVFSAGGEDLTVNMWTVNTE